MLARSIVFGTAIHLILYRLPGGKVDDGFVRPLGVVLRLLSAVYHLTLGEVIFAVGLLQEKVARVIVVLQNLEHSAHTPRLSGSCADAVIVKTFHNGGCAQAFKVLAVNAPNHLCFLGDNNILSVLTAVTENESAPGLAVFKVLLDAPLHILADRKAFLLGVGSEDGKHQLSVGTRCMNVLLLKVYVNAQLLELTNRGEKRDRVSCKTADGLGDNHIHVAVSAFGKELLEAFTLVLGSGNGFIGVHACILPAVILNVIAVIADLCR